VSEQNVFVLIVVYLYLYLFGFEGKSLFVCFTAIIVKVLLLVFKLDNGRKKGKKPEYLTSKH
jgi:hypothetical protein